jgi:two-component system chemotaxis response regulator CheY
MNTATVRRPPHAIRIVIADADGDARQRYRASFTEQGWDVVEASDGREALVKALSQRPELVVTETRLPYFDGYELCTVLRRDAVTRSVPILVVTSEARESELKRAREAGANAVLTKPIGPDLMLREIRRLLEASTVTGSGAAPVPEPRLPADQPRATQAKAHLRVKTTTPPAAPPELFCPECDGPLRYECSYLGGVNRNFAEQWDSYTCLASCGRFEYRHRTRKLRRVAA